MADVGGVASERLKSFVDRIERLERRKGGLGRRYSGNLLRSKGNRIRHQGPAADYPAPQKWTLPTALEMEELLDVYKRALEMG